MKTFKELLDEIAPVKVRMDKSADAKAKRRQARLDYKKNRTQIALARKKKRKQEKSIARKNATRRLRLPGKLSDCSRSESNGTELMLVEGDSAGGTAKQARNRETQAILPLKGKILALIFQHPSLRTRVSFEIGIRKLGGDCFYLDKNSIQIGERESVEDIAKVLD